MSFYIQLGVLIAINTIAVLGTFLLTGMNGLFSLGQGAFMGLGAYISAILVVNAGLPFSIAVIISILICAVLALLIGMASLKIKQDFFALVTFGFGQAIVAFFQEYVTVTGGAMGFSNIPHNCTPSLAFISLAVAIFFVWSFRRSHFHKDSLAIRSNELAAQVAGINVFKHKVIIFIIAAVLTSYAGALMAAHTCYVEPRMYGWMTSVTWIIIVFFGGRDSLTGVLFGSLLLYSAPEILRFTTALRMLLYSVIILIIINIRPRGLFGTWELSIEPLKSLFKPKEQEAK